MPANTRFDAVFFDLGYTLLDLLPFDPWFAGVCAEHGVPLLPEEVAGLHAGTAQEVAAFPVSAGAASLYTASVEHARHFWLSLFHRILEGSRRDYPQYLPDTLYSRFTWSDSVRVYPDVIPALTVLRCAGIRIGVISDWEAWCEQLLHHLELAPLLDFALISGVLGIGKPDPRLFRMALDQSGVPASRAVLVGDDPELDCEAAHAVGIMPVLLDRHGRHPASQWMRVEDLIGLPAWIVGGE
jgi:HAD superfamily hydrolase (TIGR01549 family)